MRLRQRFAEVLRHLLLWSTIRMDIWTKVDTVKIASLTRREEEDRRCISRVIAALKLIEVASPQRYHRLHRDLAAIICFRAGQTYGVVGRYLPRLRMCLLDADYVLDSTISCEELASVILHEAIHARLWNAGIRYSTAVEPRLERACLKRQIAFARKFPAMEMWLAQAESQREKWLEQETARRGP